MATDFILNGFLEFVFYLLDSNGVRMSKSMRPITLNDHITFYSSAILQDLFKNFTISREEILNNLLERIISSSSPLKSFIFIDQLNILIKTEHASVFQEYFRKFKGKLDHMINLTPLIAFELINAIKPLFRYDSVYKDNLIIVLKKSIYQSDLNIRMVGVCGLISLLTTTKLNSFLPASQASQSMSLSQSQSQVSRLHTHGSQEKNSEKNCLEIFLSLRRCLTQQAEIRAKLYESCYYLTCQNTTLIGPILNLLLTKLDDYLFKDEENEQMMNFNLSKIFNETTNELVEPLDILLHACYLCNMKFIELDLNSKITDLDEDIKKHSEDLKIYFDMLKDTFVDMNSNSLFDSYKKQIDIIHKNKEANNQLIKISLKESNSHKQQISNVSNETNAYQCLLGCIEVLMEYYFYINDYDTALNLFKKFNEFLTLVENHLNSLVVTSNKLKKPTTTKAKQTAKKVKGKKQQKENDESSMIDDIETTINDVIDEMVDNQIETTTLTTNKPTKQQQTSSKHVSWSYTYRLSYTTTTKLFNILFSSKQIKQENLTDNFVFYLNSNNNLMTYITNVITQKLNNLVKFNESKSSSLIIVYDCEMYDDIKLWKYLFNIWKLLWIQMNESKCLYSDCTDDTLYCAKCINTKTNYIKCLIDIWKIISTKFSSKLDDLFSIDGKIFIS